GMPTSAFPFHLLTHYFNDDAFGPLSVEFGIVDLLPRSKIEFARSHWNDDLVMDQQTLQVRIAVGLPGVMVAVVLTEGRQLLQPLIYVGNQPVFRVVDPHSGGDMHGGYQDHSVADFRLSQGCFHLWSDINILPMFLSLKCEIFRIESHTSDHTTLSY